MCYLPQEHPAPSTARTNGQQMDNALLSVTLTQHLWCYWPALDFKAASGVYLCCSACNLLLSVGGRSRQILQPYEIIQTTDTRAAFLSSSKGITGPFASMQTCRRSQCDSISAADAPPDVRVPNSAANPNDS